MKHPPQISPSAPPSPCLPAEQSNEKRLCGLLRRRSCLVPTLRGWVAFGLGFAVFLTITFRSLHPFLAVNDPIPDGLLVVEGWTADYGLEVAVDEFKRDHYQKIYVTGGPLESGTHLSAYQTYAQLGAATLVKLGLDSNVVQAVPAPLVRQDRTYTSAVIFKKWLIEHGIRPTRIHLMSDGPHARRSRLLYQKAMGDGVLIGVTSIPSKEYDQRHWWRYSAGVRNVIGEGLAYLYARFLFYPPKA
jgi:DUF218 domain-containing protein